MRSAIFEQHLRVLALAHRIDVSPDDQWIVVHGFQLPVGYSSSEISILVYIPPDYPVSPPGYPEGLFVPQGLRFQGHRLFHIHENATPGWGAWAWLCFHSLAWDCHRDDLVRFLEMIRADLSNPHTN